MGPCPLGPKEIDGLLVPPGKAYSLLTDHLITGKPLRFEPAQENWFVKVAYLRPQVTHKRKSLDLDLRRLPLYFKKGFLFV